MIAVFEYTICPHDHFHDIKAALFALPVISPCCLCKGHISNPREEDAAQDPTCFTQPGRCHLERSVCVSSEVPWSQHFFHKIAHLFLSYKSHFYSAILSHAFHLEILEQNKSLFINHSTLVSVLNYT